MYNIERRIFNFGIFRLAMPRENFFTIVTLRLFNEHTSYNHSQKKGAQRRE